MPEDALVTDAKLRLSALTGDQKRLLAQRLSRQRLRVADAIPRQSAGQVAFPLSFAQQRFWFLSQLGGLSSAYNVTEIHRLQGPLDVAALERSLNEIVRRHAVLRTTFEVMDGVPQQRIAPALTSALPLVDLSALPAAERDIRRRRELIDETQRPWSLSEGPVIRARLWRLTPDDHQLCILMHHIVSDGWSQGVLIRELAGCYEAFSNGRPSPLPELPLQYADFSVWQREWATGEDFHSQLAYWRRVMDAPPILQMPSVGTPEAELSRGTHKRFGLSRQLTAGVRELCQREGVTLFMAMQAAFAVLLSRYSGQDDIVVGTPVANRDRPELEPLIGSFMNPLPIRTDLRNNPSFRMLLARVRESALGAFANQHVPFDLLVRSLPTQREATASPLFQAMFLLQNFGLQSLRLSGGGLAARAFASVEDVPLPDDFEHPGPLMYPIALELYELGSVLAGCIEYRSEYAATMSQFPDHLRSLLAAVVLDPEARPFEVPLLTPRERSRVLVEWNHEVRPLVATCAHHLFEAEAAASPEALAVVCEDVRVTYAELNGRANALAAWLRTLGAGPEVRIGILLDRSVDMVAAVLAVMKSGGAYVPLDPAYPVERLRFIAREAGLRAILTSERLSPRIPEIVGDGASGLQVVRVEDVAWRVDAPDVDGGARPGNLAYVIFTSGSTGLPKGTMIAHASLVNAYRAWAEAYDLRHLRVHLQMASLSFDVCTGDIVRALCSGAALVVAPQELLFDPARLFAVMRRHEVDAAEFVPVVLRELAEHVEAAGESLAFVRLLVAGSDEWYLHEYQRIRQLCGPGTRLVNSYGLTEATIDSTFFDGSGGVEAHDGLVPLGRAFANTEILLLDKHLQLVPVGVAAELCVGGAGLARGYLNKPELTAERFVPHPFQPEGGARLYRTGDLARYLPDGTLELLGRIDNQVKLRGFRIELPEIESVLRTHEAVMDAAVVVREDQPGSRRLVAFVVPRAGLTLAVPELRRWLRAAVPEYMVPSVIVALAALPLTPNGKIDRTALPTAAGERQLDEIYVAPRTGLERKLAAVWCELLRLPQVGVDDNFFDLGGHSMLLMQLHARLVSALEIEVSVLDLFRFPTLSALAAQLSEPAAPGQPFAAVRGRAERQRAAIQLRRQAAEARDLRGTA